MPYATRGIASRITDRQLFSHWMQNDPPTFVGGSFCLPAHRALEAEHELCTRIQVAPVVAERARCRPREGAVVVVELLLRLIGIHVEQIARADREIDLIEA